MKNYTITVNGNVYDVTVEENGRICTCSCTKKGSSSSCSKSSSA